MYLNKVTIIGNLTKKPELKALPSGEKMSPMNIAVNSVWNDRTTGQKRESVEFISVLVFGKTAELCAQYLDKGQKVYVEGKIKNRVEEREGEKRYHTGIVGERVQFGPRTNANGRDMGSIENGENSQGRPRPAATAAGQRTIGNTGMPYPEDDINAEDIPF